MGSRYGLQIRAAAAADAAGIAELLAAAGLQVGAAALASRLDRVRSGAGAVLVAVEWGPPSGVVALHWHPTLGSDAPVAWITTLLVGAEDRRRGIGRALLKSAAQAARLAGCDRLGAMVAGEGPGPGLREFLDATGFEGGGRAYLRPLRKRG